MDSFRLLVKSADEDNARHAAAVRHAVVWWSEKVNDNEVNVWVQMRTEDVQAWFAEDLGKNPPFAPGALLCFWTVEDAALVGA